MWMKLFCKTSQSRLICEVVDNPLGKTGNPSTLWYGNVKGRLKYVFFNIDNRYKCKVDSDNLFVYF